MFDDANYLRTFDLPADVPTDVLTDLRTLSNIQLAHLTKYAFQSLSTVLHLPVKIDIDSIYQKLVLDGQGGYCYEHNLLLLHVLKALDYPVRALTGNIIHHNAPDKPLARTHILLLVTLDRQE